MLAKKLMQFKVWLSRRKNTQSSISKDAVIKLQPVSRQFETEITNYEDDPHAVVLKPLKHKNDIKY
jgi:hypothetical protein